ncbi:control protein E4orf1 [Human mastadenovirus B]
MADEVSDG